MRNLKLSLYRKYFTKIFFDILFFINSDNVKTKTRKRNTFFLNIIKVLRMNVYMTRLSDTTGSVLWKCGEPYPLTRLL